MPQIAQIFKGTSPDVLKNIGMPSDPQDLATKKGFTLEVRCLKLVLLVIDHRCETI